MDVKNMNHNLVKPPLKVDKSSCKWHHSRLCKLSKEQGI